ncbi:MAG: hypothetical protein OXM59_10915 [Gammaproteobacteria bacterium]|nr:hypothetical protein [Gammaproteobacteria bacterium]
MAAINIKNDRWEAMIGEHSNAPHLGARFLTWHSEFILRFHELLKTVTDDQQPDRAAITAWTAVPDELKRDIEFLSQTVKWDADWEQLEMKLQTDIGSFQSLDDLAREVNGLHGFLHLAVAHVHQEPHITDINNAPRSTYFWQIHGLVELWHLNWRRNLITT